MNEEMREGLPHYLYNNSEERYCQMIYVTFKKIGLETVVPPGIGSVLGLLRKCRFGRAPGNLSRLSLHGPGGPRRGKWTEWTRWTRWTEWTQWTCLTGEKNAWAPE